MDKKTLPAVIENIPEMIAFVEGVLEEHECPFKIIMNIDVAMDELLSNIAQYAYPEGTGDFTVSVDFEEQPGAVALTFSDSGIPYDPLKNPEPDVTLSLEERSIGGLGIFLVRKTMDKMEYEYSGGRNILKITKIFAAGCAGKQ